MLKLYDYKPCPWVRKTRFVLLEKGLQWEPVFLDLPKGEHKRPEYLALNPVGKVPTLIDGDVIVCDSTVVNEYLEERYPSPSLLPSTPGQRARARWFEDYADAYFASSLYKITTNLRKPEAERDRDKVAQGEREMLGHLTYLDQELEEREFLAGVFSIADIAYCSHLDNAERVGYVLPAQFRHFNTWWQRMKERPSFKESFPW